MKPNGIGEATGIERDLADRVTGVCPGRNCPLGDIKRHIEFEFNGPNDFRHKPNMCFMTVFVNILAKKKGAHSPVS